MFFESAYYSSEDGNIPSHIHEVFQRGLPADFRLVGATTRNPEDMPPALRSRCVEIFFRHLTAEEVSKISENAAKKAGCSWEDGVPQLASKYAQNGRDAVNIIQTAAGISQTEGRTGILRKDIEWVAEFGHYMPRLERKVCAEEFVGNVNGLAVFGSASGMLIEIEAQAEKAAAGKGILKVTGIIEEEEIDARGQRLKRSSSARASVENVLTVLKRSFGIECSDYDIHLNFPGGMPIDGPSAGIAIAAAIYSAIENKPVKNNIAMTGELSIKGKVKPVGGVATKVEAAAQSGVKKVLIPKDNWQETFNDLEIEVIPVEEIWEVMETAFGIRSETKDIPSVPANSSGVLSATGLNTNYGAN